MIALYGGYILDLFVGDPAWFPHPVRWIGRLIIRLEELLRPFGKSSKGLRVVGSIMALITVGITFAIAWVILWGATKVHPILGIVVNGLMIYMALATNSLGAEAEKVRKTLQTGTIEDARYQVSMLVSRDTDHLDSAGVARATVETVAENFSDGVVAPLFYAALGGAPLAMAYKAVNTLDSMVGYKNWEYLHFGWFSARLDDWANWIPARLSTVFVWMGAFILRLSADRSVKIVKRDSRNHSSPNSGYPEAAFAGALEIQMGGASRYFGTEVLKPTIGDALVPITEETIQQAVSLLYVSSLMGLFSLSAILGLIQWLIVR